MGYYTDYKLTIEKEDESVSAYDIASKMKEMYDKNEAFYPLIDDIEDVLEDERSKEKNSLSLKSYEEAKWYDNPEDMHELSKTFPNVIFVLHGEGEEQGDIWSTYYKNGVAKDAKVEIKITPPTFD